MANFNDNKYCKEEMEEIYNEIKGNAVEQVDKAMPVLGVVSEKLEKTFEMLLIDLQKAKEVKNSHKNELGNLKIEMEDLEKRIELIYEELSKTEAENQFMNHLLDENQKEVAKIVKGHETVLNQLSKKFKEAPALYEPSVLQVEVDAITSDISKNEVHIEMIKEEISNLQISFLEPVTKDIALDSAKEVMADFEAVDRLTANLAAQEMSLKKYNEKLSNEIQKTMNVQNQ